MEKQINLKTLPRKEMYFVLLLVLASGILFFIGKEGWFLNDDFFLLDKASSLHILQPYYRGLFFRPLAHLTFFLQRSIFGLKFTPYLALNIAIHLFTTLLLYANLTILAKENGLEFPSLTGKILVAIFFIHPTGIEVVQWSSARADSLAGLFTIATIFAFLNKRITLALIFYTLALFSKEIAIALLAPLFILAWQRERDRHKKIWLASALIATLYILLRYAVLKHTFFSSLEQDFMSSIQKTTHLLFYIFLPNFKYCIKIMSIVPHSLLLILFFLGLLASSVFSVKLSKKNLYVVFGVWVFLASSLTSQIIGLRYLYLPLIFGVLFIYSLKVKLVLSLKIKHYINVFLVIVLFLYIHLFGLQMDEFLIHGKMVKTFAKDIFEKKAVFTDKTKTIYNIDFLPKNPSHFLNRVSFSALLRLYGIGSMDGRILFTVFQGGKLIYSNAPQALKPGSIKQDFYDRPPHGYLIFFKPDRKIWRIERIVKNF